MALSFPKGPKRAAGNSLPPWLSARQGGGVLRYAHGTDPTDPWHITPPDLEDLPGLPPPPEYVPPEGTGGGGYGYNPPDPWSGPNRGSWFAAEPEPVGPPLPRGYNEGAPGQPLPWVNGQTGQVRENWSPGGQSGSLSDIARLGMIGQFGPDGSYIGPEWAYQGDWNIQQARNVLNPPGAGEVRAIVRDASPIPPAEFVARPQDWIVNPDGTIRPNNVYTIPPAPRAPEGSGALPGGGVFPAGQQPVAGQPSGVALAGLTNPESPEWVRPGGYGLVTTGLGGTSRVTDYWENGFVPIGPDGNALPSTFEIPPGSPVRLYRMTDGEYARYRASRGLGSV